jgi:hypothetical protein
MKKLFWASLVVIGLLGTCCVAENYLESLKDSKPIVAEQDPRNGGIVISQPKNAKFVWYVAVVAHESNGKMIYTIVSQQADKDAPPMSPWAVSKVGLFLANHSLPPEKGVPNLVESK